ncbi:DUF6192 family protein [Streptomyces yangpuensis]|uniref:DUF6192 family protein n=1 Tax=Streptomyces yangpuensis TaxID=1648182 RepID=UPI00364969B3
MEETQTFQELTRDDEVAKSVTTELLRRPAVARGVAAAYEAAPAFAATGPAGRRRVGRRNNPGLGVSLREAATRDAEPTTAFSFFASCTLKRP